MAMIIAAPARKTAALVGMLLCPMSAECLAEASLPARPKTSAPTKAPQNRAISKASIDIGSGLYCYDTLDLKIFPSAPKEYEFRISDSQGVVLFVKVFDSTALKKGGALTQYSEAAIPANRVKDVEYVSKFGNLESPPAPRKVLSVWGFDSKNRKVLAALIADAGALDENGPPVRIDCLSADHWEITGYGSRTFSAFFHDRDTNERTMASCTPNYNIFGGDPKSAETTCHSGNVIIDLDSSRCRDESSKK